jgi:hypothetical protein
MEILSVILNPCVGQAIDFAGLDQQHHDDYEARQREIERLICRGRGVTGQGQALSLRIGQVARIEAV